LRGPTTLTELQIKWDHPVPPKPKDDPERTFAIPRQALPLEEALAAIRGSDPRPLLVLRECTRCTGTEDALLTRMVDNERTFLMSRWFHCVKLPPAVLEPEHAFHNLFPGDKPAHVFVSQADGSQRHDLVGGHSQRVLWTAMREVLASTYRDDPERALAKLSKILDRFDELDDRILDLQRRIDVVIESEGPATKEAVKLRGELSAMLATRNDLHEEVARVSKLAQLQPPGLGAKKAG
jgi:uncharacterized protein YdcH (DUF465 family)